MKELAPAQLRTTLQNVKFGENVGREELANALEELLFADPLNEKSAEWRLEGVNRLYEGSVQATLSNLLDGEEISSEPPLRTLLRAIVAGKLGDDVEPKVTLIKRFFSLDASIAERGRENMSSYEMVDALKDMGVDLVGLEAEVQLARMPNPSDRWQGDVAEKDRALLEHYRSVAEKHRAKLSESRG
eukprot:CAMPEP_0202738026 /NCGR_PEP_ID=MMETSP1388-20130828/1859_1 /ASSEMBLY_ACC=CAM_ASM_000864 /TAXON_ID=37098 /ORGANISM="Isochrysis sp, Strain CCMP1244" /LENGTH=186 /DNA_ID=CAMNT_0049404577 /DNA_START=18 /DNA_END=578 /DNA_ORIENTATION=-